MIAKERNVILVEVTSYTGNLKRLARQIIEKHPVNKMKSYADPNNVEYEFHVLSDNSQSFICMSESKISRLHVFRFLKELSLDFYQHYTERDIYNAVDFSFQDGFKSSLQELMNNYNKGGGELESSKRLLPDLLDLKETSVENLAKILKRGEKVDVICAKAEQIKGQSQTYRQRTVKYKTSQKRRYWCYCLMGLAVVAVIVLIILLSVCGFHFQC